MRGSRSQGPPPRAAEGDRWTGAGGARWQSPSQFARTSGRPPGWGYHLSADTHSLSCVCLFHRKGLGRGWSKAAFTSNCTWPRNLRGTRETFEGMNEFLPRNSSFRSQPKCSSLYRPFPVTPSSLSDHHLCFPLSAFLAYNLSLIFV